MYRYSDEPKNATKRDRMSNFMSAHELHAKPSQIIVYVIFDKEKNQNIFV